MIAYMLTNELGQLMDWVEVAKVGQRSYWVCALLGSIPHSFSFDGRTGWADGTGRTDDLSR